MKQKYYCKNELEEDLFYIELIDLTDLESLSLEFSFEKNIFNNSNVDRIKRCIEERLVPADLRNYFIQRLFKYILEIPNIENYFLPEHYKLENKN